MQVLSSGAYKELEIIAKKKRVSVQEIIRVLVVPDFLEKQITVKTNRRSAGAARGWVKRKSKKTLSPSLPPLPPPEIPN